MASRGKALLALVGMKPKSKEGDEPDGDEEEDAPEDEEPGDADSAAEELCTLLGCDEEHADRVRRLIAKIAAG